MVNLSFINICFTCLIASKEQHHVLSLSGYLTYVYCFMVLTLYTDFLVIGMAYDTKLPLFTLHNDHVSSVLHAVSVYIIALLQPPDFFTSPVNSPTFLLCLLFWATFFLWCSSTSPQVLKFTQTYLTGHDANWSDSLRHYFSHLCPAPVCPHHTTLGIPFASRGAQTILYLCPHVAVVTLLYVTLFQCIFSHHLPTWQALEWLYLCYIQWTLNLFNYSLKNMDMKGALWRLWLTWENVFTRGCFPRLEAHNC